MSEGCNSYPGFKFKSKTVRKGFNPERKFESEQSKENSVSVEKRLGKIKHVYFGILDDQLGLHLRVGGKKWSYNWSESFHDPTTIKIDNNTEWTQNDRDSEFLQIIDRVSKVLNDAGVKSVSKLKDIPIECTFEGKILKNWRILTEVL